MDTSRDALRTVRQGLNWVNLSTPLGLLLAAVGGARVRRGPHGLFLAQGHRLPLPRQPAFTVGDVVLLRYDDAGLSARPTLLDHEARHAWQWAVLLGLPFLPLYWLAAGWSLLRAGDAARHNVFERLAGLADGGYLPR